MRPRNARPYIGKKVDAFFAFRRMMRAAHPPDPPEFAPRDFFLFAYIKERLKERWFDDPDQLLRAISAVCASIEKVILEKVFSE
jgi:hypothetical protein